MERNAKTKSILIVLIFCSVLSAAYLQFNDPSTSTLSTHHSFVEQYIKEKSYLPEVKFVKELLRTIFNVVNA
jgi:hypothetical protein